jgi:hypothetical protein
VEALFTNSGPEEAGYGKNSGGAHLCLDLNFDRCRVHLYICYGVQKQLISENLTVAPNPTDSITKKKTFNNGLNTKKVL